MKLWHVMAIAVASIVLLFFVVNQDQKLTRHKHESICAEMNGHPFVDGNYKLFCVVDGKIYPTKEKP